ncbi:hypothetical protein [Longimicrobium terrae]|uniref:Fibronectin type-III domain-containing protein n=1 Tax=Longimicrobium terrae TaxID=1639882 RepID=A0A841GVY4_9BACT|nr:hypothetical protein [Longimicrobium terrae]MBB4635249.1 hypothetical protein [Longimicrobium terrae]MBB6069643.1 hypothetical protein [Longimicrobium terrae]NNC31146.1 hypothetical protein [Longimicrobium terrae]
MRKRTLVLALALLSACDGAPEHLTSAEPGARPLLTTCATPSIVSPTSNQVIYTSTVQLKWTVGDCANPKDVEVYDNATSTLVFSDATAEFETFSTSGVFTYSSVNLSGYTAGQYYKWRTRSRDFPDTTNVGPWSGYGVFGLPMPAPATTASVVSGNPTLSWPAVTGATYRIHRMADYVGTWDTGWDTASGTGYSDPGTTVTGYVGTTQPSSGKWVAYRVVAVSSAGIASLPGTIHYFSYTGFIIV